MSMKVVTDSMQHHIS